MQGDTTNNHGDWKRRIRPNNKISLLQAWFSSTWSPLAPIEFLHGIERIQSLSMSIISQFPILTTSSPMHLSPISPSLHYFGPLFSLWATLVLQKKYSRVCCFALILSAKLWLPLCVTQRHVIPLFQILLVFLRHNFFISTSSLHFSLKIQVCYLCLLHPPLSTFFILLLMLPQTSFPSWCKFSFKFFLLPKSDSVHLIQIQNKKAGPLSTQDVF